MANALSDEPIFRLGTIDTEKPIRPQIYAQLRDAIIRTRVRPGAVISEKEIGQQLQVSRTPIREAVIRLIEDGLVEVRPQIGTFATKLRLGEIREAMFVREALECAAVRAASRNATPGDADRLTALVERQEKAREREDSDTVYEIDTELHRTLIGMSGHPGVWKLVQTTRAHMARLRFLVVPILGTVDQALSDHRAIVDAVTRGDEDTAAERMRSHLTINLAYAERLLDQRPDLFDPAERQRERDRAE